MKKILFITWDGPQTSYMEGLFMPIFEQISKTENIQFHVIQFTWAEETKIRLVREKAKEMGVVYTAFPVLRKPVASLGSMITVRTSAGKIKKYIRENQIDLVLPRSTFPAMMVNLIKNRNFKILFDADGLPIEERLDFSGLKKDSFQYRWMKSAETRMLKNADAVITRSQKAVDIHVQTIGEAYRPKFSVVKNGRNKDHFQKNEDLRHAAREELGIGEEFLFVYAGSLGPQYCLPEMQEIFTRYAEKRPSKFLILTGNPGFAEQQIPVEISGAIILKSVAADKVPFYLNAADCAFGLREPSFSMQGVAPIKLGEYLLCGLPVIASKGIGDTEAILQEFEACFLYEHGEKLNEQLEDIMEFIKKINFADKEQIRERALEYFSLEAAAGSYKHVLDQLK